MWKTEKTEGLNLNAEERKVSSSLFATNIGKIVHCARLSQANIDQYGSVGLYLRISVLLYSVLHKVAEPGLSNPRQYQQDAWMLSRKTT